MTAKLDRRVAILAQLLDIVKSLSVTLTTGAIAPGNFVHNRNDLPRDLIPGIIVLDADETKDPRFVVKQAGRSIRPGPQMMRMTPEIYIVLDVRKPGNANVGEDLNTARAAILNAILHNPILRALVSDNGEITYDGCVTDLARNRIMEGQMGLSITFVYPLIPDELLPA